MIYNKQAPFARAMPALALSLALLAAAPASAGNLPGKGVKVQPLQSSIAEETFQTLLVGRALETLGYEVKPIQEVEYPTAHIAIANGDATFMAVHWDPMHRDFYDSAGGDAKLVRGGAYAGPAAQGYLIDKATADKYNITHVDQLRDPTLAKLFDGDGDGKADLTGCTPGWGCEQVIEHQMSAFKLRETVRHVQGSYTALMADTIGRFKRGQPILYYTWTPYWVSSVLRPGVDVVWLKVPFSALPGSQAKVDTQLADGSNYGFPMNTARIVANKQFAAANPAAARLFEVMRLPVADINAQNERMRNGQGSAKDVARHADAWIKWHRKTYDEWIAQALAAAKK
jgi:glycine betaine/proline transport system substrate-binding protein